jgi:SAM-dependent methyltransferase
MVSRYGKGAVTGGMPQAAARGFGATADLYEARRPTYPETAIGWLTTALGIQHFSTVVDLGAGTGKLTRRIAAKTRQVIAVEPLAAMCGQFSSVLNVPLVRAVAEAIPVRSGSVDAVLVGQAFHWFDAETALSEIHRVLRPGGGLGLVWNMRDERTDWVAALGEIRRRYGDIRYDTGRWREALNASDLFAPLVEEHFAYDQVLDPEGVVELMASRSFIAALDGDENRAVREEIRRLMAEHPETAGRGRLVLPYKTDAYWTRRLNL